MLSILADIFVSKKLQFNNEKYSQGEWNKLGWHDLFDVWEAVRGWGWGGWG